MFIVVFGLATVMAVISVSDHGDAVRTSYTQAHGVRRTARVISENTSGGKDPTSAVEVRLSGRVNGYDTTTVHINGSTVYSPGAQVTVVVDPHDPGYAELPGAPYTSSAQWEISLAIGLLDILAVMVTMGIVRLRQSRSRRRLRAALLR